MRTLLRLSVIVFALVAATSVFYAFQQQKALKLARNAAESLEKERNDLRKKLWDADKRRGELEAQLRNRRGGPGSDGEPGPGDGSVENAAVDATIRFAREAEGGPFGRFMAMMDNPEIQRLMAQQQRGALDSRYATLFKNLNLTPAQLEQFKNLLVEKRTSVADVMAAARSQGLTGRDNRDELRALVQNAQNEVDNNIRATIGDAAFAQYQNFEQTQPQRTVVSQLQQRLSYTDAPLTDAQSEQLVQLLATTTEQKNPSAGGVRTPAGRLGFGGNGGAQITDNALQQSATVLSASQQQALQQLQAEQQAQAQLAKLMREQFQRRGGPGTSTGTGAPSTTTPAQIPTPPRG
ncbi:MAG: hypothetical protein KF715_02485 [Candidatus Didemnitutus sp.]|nr:hypothetical protein [Candidatus Didemnitutus sp.]